MSRKGIVAALILVLAAGSGLAYEGAIHQQLTFIAARHYNRCVEEAHYSIGADTSAEPLARLTPLQVRYVAKANANQAAQPWWQRLFRWNYYDRGDQLGGKILWLVETRMHNSYRNTLRRLENARDLSRRFTNLGRVVSYVQDATTPAHVVPVFTNRWWRLSVSDRFNTFPVDEAAVEQALGGDCARVRGADGTFEDLLVSTAERTIAAIVEPIRGMPSNWEAFWELNKDNDNFGRYGEAGNTFGRNTTFSCTKMPDQDCVLTGNDPIYREFANIRHVEAVQATISAMAMVQWRLRATAPSSNGRLVALPRSPG